jgi:CRP-like cAMP-binding protein/Fe-S-cluster-containing hydrogenase component 2/thioredoxin reductase
MDATELYEIVIVGSGPAGLSAAARAKALGVRHVLLEAQPHLSDTIYQYQKGKHVMAEPGILPLRSDLGFSVGKREAVLSVWNEEMKQQGVNVEYGQRVTAIVRDADSGIFTLTTQGNGTGARTWKSKAVILAIGLQGNIRKLGVPGEDLPQVQYTLSDPDEYEGETIVVVGAGDAGIENALALAEKNTVYILNRQEEFATCKEGNRVLITAAEKSGKIKVRYSASTKYIEPGSETPLNFIFNGKHGEEWVHAHRVIARLGATPPRKLIESFGVVFPNANPASTPALSDSYESNVPGLYIVGALGGYPLIKQAMNQGYEVVQTIVGKPVQPADETLLREKLVPWRPGVQVSKVIEEIKASVPLFSQVTTLQLREFMLESTLLTPRKGDIIFRKFDYTNTFYSILEGTVEIELAGNDGKVRQIKLDKGQYFGEMGLISGRRRSATIRAGEHCVLMETPRRTMLKLIASVDDVRKRMDMVFVRNAIYNYLGNMLSRTAIDALVAGGVTVKRFEAKQHLFKEGDPADGMYLIRRGSVTVSRKDEARGGERILSYVAAGNYVGEMALLRDAPRSATVTATVLTEALVLDAETVRDQLIANPSWRKSVEDQVISRTEQNVLLEHTKSRDGDLMQFLLGQGVGEASDVLLINETMCIQCNNCETACAETHNGTSRLKRALGPTFANIHLPTACRHCENPHCMKDCPPDAIGRSLQGEVFISDACIGCGNCERNCPYGVIQMAVDKPPKRGGGLSWLLFGLGATPGERQADYDPSVQKKAVKCDLCKDLKGGPSCVRACPTGAAIRISPEKFFKNQV